MSTRFLNASTRKILYAIKNSYRDSSIKEKPEGSIKSLKNF